MEGRPPQPVALAQQDERDPGWGPHRREYGWSPKGRSGAAGWPFRRPTDRGPDLESTLNGTGRLFEVLRYLSEGRPGTHPSSVDSSVSIAFRCE
jgi:hypothetical protein